MHYLSTVIVTPRDRYTGVLECVQTLLAHTPEPIALWVLDLGYPERVIAPVRCLLTGRPGARIVDLGRITPMRALDCVRADIATPSVVLLDNDSRVVEGWLAPLQQAVAAGASIAHPLVLEREGLDRGADLRNHLYTAEFRSVEVDGTDYLIEHKHLRRVPLAQIPRAKAPTQTFELHCVMFATAALRELELPDMVIREHLDIALQVQARGGSIWVEPRSLAVFDNLNERLEFDDMRYFYYRWNRALTERSARLFERRWGYRFYSEQAMYNWVFRRKAFLLARWLGLPIGLANRTTALAYRLFCRDWNPVADPDAASRPFPGQRPLAQLSHDLA